MQPAMKRPRYGDGSGGRNGNINGDNDDVDDTQTRAGDMDLEESISNENAMSCPFTGYQEGGGFQREDLGTEGDFTQFTQSERANTYSDPQPSLESHMCSPQSFDLIDEGE